jgi:L-rhamnose mutarotase
MSRHGSVIQLIPEKVEEYKQLHREVWPSVILKMRECGIRNYSIYYKDGYLFSYFDYVGDNYLNDMAKMAADPDTQRWWKLCGPCQQPLDTRKSGEWWAEMEELFHMD